MVSCSVLTKSNNPGGRYQSALKQSSLGSKQVKLELQDPGELQESNISNWGLIHTSSSPTAFRELERTAIQVFLGKDLNEAIYASQTTPSQALFLSWRA